MASLILGLTGSFGSGCGEVSKFLENKFQIFSLTKYIRDEFNRKHPGRKPDREDLQDTGDELRKKFGNDILVKKLLKEIPNTPDPNKGVVIKSIRNHSEADALRKKFGDNFYLINVDADKQIRFNRVKDEYPGDKKSALRKFEKEDERDSGENQPEYGQQVRKCVDVADIVINNNYQRLNDLYGEIKKIDFLGLIENPGKRDPTDIEIGMNHAFQEIVNSRCLKRCVGAVIMRGRSVICSGYNDSPPGTARCFDLGKCYREEIVKCSNKRCNTSIQIILDKCNRCRKEVIKDKQNLLKKNLDLCRAIHAEERAILQVSRLGGQSLKKAILYTTTFPCLLCAKMIAEVGLSEVVYLDPYPYEEAIVILKEASIILTKFKGIKAFAFRKLFTKNI